MARIKNKKHHEPGEHIWTPMEKYQVDEEKDINILEESIENEITKLRKMEPNTSYVAKTLPAKEKNTQPFLDYIEKLKDYDLDINRNDSAEYGYKMPNAEKGKPFRELTIFRRAIIREEKEFRRK